MQSGKEGCTNRAAIDLLVATSAHRLFAAFVLAPGSKQLVRAGRRCWSQGSDERRRPPNRALLLSPTSKRARTGRRTSASALAHARAALLHATVAVVASTACP